MSEGRKSYVKGAAGTTSRETYVKGAAPRSVKDSAEATPSAAGGGEPGTAKVVPFVTQIERLLDVLHDMPRKKREDAIDEILSTFCTNCAQVLDEHGGCPDGCDPDDLLDEAEEDDDEDEDDGDDEDGDDEDGDGDDADEIATDED